MFDPAGIRPFVEEWDKVAAALLQRVRREAVGQVLDAKLQDLLKRLREYPGRCGVEAAGCSSGPCSADRVPARQPTLSLGCLIFEHMDQIDFTGPFEVLSRMPDTRVQIIGEEPTPIRDVQGLRLTPDVRIAEAGIFDVLLVPGGYGQQALMHDEEVLDLIRKHVEREKLPLSVCAGALLCGAAGVLVGRQMTTHWSARHLMRYYGAARVDARVVVDGNLISAAGVTAGLDAALALVSLLRGDAAAQEIQLAIEYAPDPIFHSGTPDSAPPEVLEGFQKEYEPIGREREAEAILHAERHEGRL